MQQPSDNPRPARRVAGRVLGLLSVVAVVAAPLLPIAPAAASSDNALSSDALSSTASSTTERDRAVVVGEMLVLRLGERTSTVSWEEIPDGAWASNRGRVLIWRPDSDALGRHRIAAIVDGLAEVTIVDVLAPRSEGLVLAMGDSIASGQGLELTDYFGTDECNRDEDRGGAWTRRVFDELAADGRVTDFAMVACGGARTHDLWTDDVDGGPGELAAGPMSQLEWAVAANPDLILLTIGANDLRFDKPQAFFDDDGDFDRALADRRIASAEANLGRILGTLVEQTSSRIVVTTVHNPTSLTPHGLPGCRGQCFYDVTAYVVEELRAAITRAGAAYPRRVSVVDVSDALDGHGAPNGRGLDSLRAGSGWFASRLPIPTEGVHPYCQRGHAEHDTWINAADCVHPNGEGHQAYAERVLAALTYWRP